MIHTLCYICGKKAEHVCKLCGRHVCSEHYDKATGLCINCLHGRKIKKIS